jgi:diaminopimelate dehydrogenase
MSSEPIKVGIIGWGNVGRGVYEAIKRSSDMCLSGIVSRTPERAKAELGKGVVVYSFPSVLGPSLEIPRFYSMIADVAILCGGSAKDLPVQGPYFTQHFNTVDSFDTHVDIPAYFGKMNSVARKNNKVAIISAGWDPGTFSLERVLGDAFLPGSTATTFWGPGVSQGHSDAIRRVEGVADGIQYTMPKDEAIKQARDGSGQGLKTGDKHWRNCYIALKPGADEAAVVQAIRTMPKYFADYETKVTIETPKQITERKRTMPHGGFVLTSGETGKGNKALIEYRNGWASNPEATGSILVACARANYRLQQRSHCKGAFTMLDIPPALFSPRSREELLKSFM